MGDDKTRVGIIGAGKIGGYHANIAAGLSEATLSGIYDLDTDRASRLAADHGAMVRKDLEQLLMASDAVVIATPTSTHYELVRAALAADIDVLVEKPIARTSAQAEELATMARRSGRHLHVGHIERFNAAWRALEQIDPYFIEAHRMSGFSLRSLDVSVILDLMIHDIDLVQSICGGAPVEIRATGVPVLSGEIDIANVRLEFASGAVANLTASRISRDPLRKLRIFGHHEYHSLDFSRPTLERLRLKGSSNRTVPKLGSDDLSQAVPLPVALEEVPLQQINPMEVQLREFLAVINGSGRPTVSLEDAVAAVRTAEDISNAIADSALTRRLSSDLPGVTSK